MKKGLSRFNSIEFDTEGKEFITDYFFELSKIVDVDIKSNLNGWLYGKGINTFLKILNFFKKPEKVIETISEECSKCKSPLEVYILEKRADIDFSSFNIIKV